MPSDPFKYTAWFDKAGEDELSAAGILEDERGAPGTVCFLSQQMAEKYLKGLLVHHRIPFQKVHDLLRIAKLLQNTTPEISQHEKDLELLNGFYIEARYPGDWPEFSWQDAKEAFFAAKRIKDFVLNSVK